MYLEETTYQYIKFMKSFLTLSFSYSKTLDFTKEDLINLNKLNTLYINMNEFNFLGMYEKEIIARNVIMDLLKRTENLLREEFLVEGYAGKVLEDNETYNLYFDIQDKTYLFLTISLEKYDDKFYISGNYFDLKNNLDVITKNITQVDCLNEVAILKIKYNEEGVSKQALEIQETLNKNNISNTIIKGEGGFYQNEEGILNSLIPLIVEVGPSNIKKHQLTLVSKLGRIQIDEEKYLEEIVNLLAKLKKNEQNNSLNDIFTKRVKQKNFDLLKVNEKLTCCLNPNCVSKIKEKTQCSKIIIPFNQNPFTNQCIVCLNNAREIIIPLVEKNQKN
jgi:hypothetical protein